MVCAGARLVDHAVSHAVCHVAGCGDQRQLVAGRDLDAGVCAGHRAFAAGPALGIHAMAPTWRHTALACIRPVSGRWGVDAQRYDDGVCAGLVLLARFVVIAASLDTLLKLDALTALDMSLLAISCITAFVLLQPRLRQSPFWQATITPLASIIGSGFLVAVPMLASIAGRYALLAMLLIVVVSLWLGSALRYNMGHASREQQPGYRALAALERFSELALALAYVISITFYVRLLSGFVLTGIDAYSIVGADIAATAVLLFIGVYGWRNGLAGLERMETYSVTLKLAIIAALLFALAVYAIGQGGLNAGFTTSTPFGWQQLCQLAGLLLVVQGFETSKYLGASYSVGLRMRSMAAAQCIAGAIYIGFVALAQPLMPALADQPASETAIINMVAVVTLILPFMLVVAAAMSQFSAAIADTIGAGGVIETESRERISSRRGYLLVAVLAVVLTWSCNIFEVIALASRAFALYYLIQTVQSVWLSATESNASWRWLRASGYVVLSVVLLFIMLFAAPLEG